MHPGSNWNSIFNIKSLYQKKIQKLHKMHWFVVWGCFGGAFFLCVCCGVFLVSVFCLVGFFFVLGWFFFDCLLLIGAGGGGINLCLGENLEIFFHITLRLSKKD